MAAQEQITISAIDYAIFGLMLLVSLVIGIIYALRDRKSEEGTEGYLMAGRSMSAIPAGISLAASFQSSVTILGFPNDIHLYGITYIWTAISLALTFLVVSFVFIPTVYHLGISSAYEYLGQRYNKLMGLTSTTFYLLSNLLYMGVNIYGPALTLSTVTGFDLVTAMLSTGLVCIIYTTLGGLRGVIWTDVFQAIIMTMGMLAVIIQTAILKGSWSEIWRIAIASGRASSNYSTDPHARYTFGSVVFGTFIIWTAIFGTNQAQVQRMISVKSQKESMKALGIGILGIVAYTVLAATCGVVSYTIFSECDPMVMGCIERNDERYAFGVFNIFQSVPGLSGLFLACVYSASLSTVSSGVNAMSTVIMADFIKPHTEWSERSYTRVAKGATLLLGLVILGIGILSSAVGDIVLLGVIGASAFTCPCLAVFILGIWCPFANAWGALCGMLIGFASSCVVLLGSHTVHRVDAGLLEMSTTRCPINCDFDPSKNTTYVSIVQANISSGLDQELHGIENLYSLSIYYIALLIFIETVIVTLIVSLLTGGWKQRFDVKHHLIRPPFESSIFRWIPENIRSCLRCGINWSEGRAHNTEKEDDPEIHSLRDLNETI